RSPRFVRTLTLGVTLSRMNETVKAVVGSWIKMAENGEIEAIVLDMIPKMYSDKYIKKYGRLLPLISKFTKLEDPNRFIVLAKACLTCDIYEELEKIACPVFVIGGRRDKVVTGEASEETAKKLGEAKCRLFMYEELGHAAYEEAKDFNQRILDFILHADNTYQIK
ncbi:MAG: alpha/beta hydrolase, partial [Oscillospiraceae bacterium]|nr:alpha/beta hydrolase [Oscillospiraceae bacterium]